MPRGRRPLPGLLGLGSLGLLLGGALPAQSDAVPALVEGPIQAIRPITKGLELDVMGQRLRIMNWQHVDTPTARLTLAEFAAPSPLPGRTLPGFVGATAIGRGAVDAAVGVVVLESLFVEPAENVTVGAVTANQNGLLSVNGMPVLLLADPRLPALAPHNEFGFAIVLASAPVGSPVAVSGYHDGSWFRAFDVSVGGNARLVSSAPQILVQRASAREYEPNDRRGDELDVRGAITTAHAPTASQTIQLFRIDRGVATPLTTTSVAPAPATPGFASWTVRFTTPTTTDPVLGRAPTRLRAVNVSPGAGMAAHELDVDVR